MKISKCEIKIRYSEIGLYSVVHHSKFSEWCDVALSSLLEENGLSIHKLSEMGLQVPIFNMNLRYVSPVSCDQVLRIETKILTLGPAKVTFGYEFYCEDKLVAYGSTDHIFTNGNMRPLNLKRLQPELYETFKGYLANE